MPVNRFYIVLNYCFAALIAGGGVFWVTTGDTFGYAMGVAAIASVAGLVMRKPWGYFAAAVWCFGLMRLATDDYSAVFPEHWKYAARGLCFVGVALAVLLHETVAIKTVNPPDDEPGTPS